MHSFTFLPQFLFLLQLNHIFIDQLVNLMFVLFDLSANGAGRRWSIPEGEAILKEAM
jgi:hypothetical protein